MDMPQTYEYFQVLRVGWKTSFTKHSNARLPQTYENFQASELQVPHFLSKGNLGKHPRLDLTAEILPSTKFEETPAEKVFRGSEISDAPKVQGGPRADSF